MHKKLFGPRSIANKVWFASISPAAMGLAAFSFVLVAFGSTLYVSSVPGMVVSDTPYVASITDAQGNAEATEGENPGLADSSENPNAALLNGIAEIASAYSSGDGSLGPGATSIVQSGLSVPVLDFADPSEGDPPQEDPSSPVDPSTPSEPEKPPAEPTEEEKRNMEIHDGFVRVYNALPALYEQVVNAYTDFYNNHAADRATRQIYYNNSVELNKSIKAAYFDNIYEAGLGEVVNDSSSIWYDQNAEIKALYTDLENAMTDLWTAWRWNYAMNKPYETYIKYIQRNSINGQSKFLLDFVERYPGAAL